MKNALWFLYKPQDERERELYYHAYARSFNFLVAALMVGFVVVRWIPFNGIHADNIMTFLMILVVTAYYLGWKTLQKEEVTINAEFSKKLPSVYVVWGVLSMLVLVYVGVKLVLSRYGLNASHEIADTIFVIVWAVVVRVLAWFSTDKLQLPIRVGLVLGFPLITLVLSRIEGKTWSDKIFKALWWLIIPLALILIVTFSFVMRTYVSTP